SACGVSIQGADTEHVHDQQKLAAQRAAVTKFRLAQAKLPPRPAGQIAIEGEAQNTITAQAAQDFTTKTTGVRAEFHPVGDATSFADLCSGNADIVEVTRPISAEELKACANNGVRLAAPLEVGANALVVATRNDSDVGGDCVGVPTVRKIFRRG